MTLSVTISAANVKMRFPEFVNVADATIEFAIQDARRGVDDSWTADDRIPALLQLTGHYLMVEIQRAESASGQKVKSERIGELSVTYADDPKNTAADPSDYETTSYGQRYLQLLKLNSAGIAVI